MSFKVIAIDGPAGSGKGTIAHFLAKSLNYTYVDSGLFYRYVTYSIKNQLNFSLLLENPCNFFDPIMQYLQTGEDILDLIKDLRSEDCGQMTSKISQNLEIRAFVTKAIRHFSKISNIVIDGRDTTTVIFPKAHVKLFITASIQERAYRRLQELGDHPSKIQDYVQKIQYRDNQDSTRSFSPLIQTKDAILIDTSQLTIEQTCEKALNIVRKIL